MQALERVFQSGGWSIRVLVVDGEPWFVGGEVAEALGYERPKDAVAAHCKGAVKRRLPTAGGEQDVATIHERDFYRLVMRSRLPSAQAFEEWVVGEVLPSIRKTGSYGAPALDLRDPAQLAPIALQLARLVEDQQRQLAEAKPAVEFVDRFVDATGRYTLQNAGRVLGVGANRFPKWLLDRHYLHRQDGRLVPYAQYLEAGLFEVKVVKVQAGRGEAEHAYQQTYVTAKGIKRFAGELAQEALVLT